VQAFLRASLTIVTDIARGLPLCSR
jgi:hypothetical protein